METPKQPQFPNGELPDLSCIPQYIRDGGKEPFVEIVETSKELVDFLLSINIHNRSHRPRVSAQYQRDVEAKKWHLTNQGIGIIYTEEVIDGALCPFIYLADGQHRIMAIKSSGYLPVKLIILWNMKPEAQACIDLQSRRQARDLMKLIHNSRVSHHAPAIARILIRDKMGWSVQPSMQEVLETIQDIECALEQVCMVPKQSKFFAAPYLAAFVKAALESPDEFYKVKVFMERVEAGEMLKSGDPELTLRSYLLSGFAKASNGMDVQQDRFRKTLRALRAFYAKEKLHLLR